MKDPYEILGIAREAPPDEIRKSYLRLAKKLHPDLNPGNKDSEDRFKEVSAAHDLLSDPDKRKRFDSGEIDASGAERPREPYWKDFASDAAAGRRYDNRSGYADFADEDDLFADLLRRQTRQSRKARGADVRYRLSVDFLEAVNGATKRLTLPGGDSLDVTIPPGLEDGQVLRLRGKGEKAMGEGDDGDALIEIAVNPHRFFVRQGDDILVDLPVTLKEAVLGGQVETPTPSGPVLLTIPKGSNTGAVLRLKGKGVPRRGGAGDQLVKLKIMAPTQPDAALEAFLANWNPGPGYDPRKDLRP